LRHGLLWDYGGVPLASAAFWTSLTLLDPVAIILLIVRPNVGVLATAVIIITDVFHNLWITARYAQPHQFSQDVMGDPFDVSQILFMLFVMATTSIAWSRSKQFVTSEGT
jgi:hypothetical protein